MSGRQCRALCADMPVVIEFSAPTSPEQQLWLFKTHVRVRRVAFDVNDKASVALLVDPLMLVGG